MSNVFKRLVISLVAVAVLPVIVGWLLEPLPRGVVFLAWQWVYGQRGVRALAVYSESPKWQRHFEREVLPFLGARGHVVNTTQVPTWRRSGAVARKAHRQWGGGQNHTPIVIWFPRRFGKVRVVRFYEAYGRATDRSADAQFLAQAIQATRQLACESASPAP